MQTLVEAYNSAWTATYEDQKENPKNAPKAAKQILQSMPLTLGKTMTNYWDAFVFPSANNHGTTRRIYKGSGTVEKREKLFYLSDNKTPDFFVVINIQHVENLRGYQKKMLDLILSAQQNQLTIKWYAYGSPLPHNAMQLLHQESRRAQQAFSRVVARSALRCRPDNRPQPPWSSAHRHALVGAPSVHSSPKWLDANHAAQHAPALPAYAVASADAVHRVGFWGLLAPASLSWLAAIDLFYAIKIHHRSPTR
ncbi:hypothetical protein AB4090_08360 [Acidithiobacillus sp. IBUN Pt1247-S3]